MRRECHRNLPAGCEVRKRPPQALEIAQNGNGNGPYMKGQKELVVFPRKADRPGG